MNHKTGFCRVLLTITMLVGGASCGGDEPSRCELGCETVLDLCGPERTAAGCIDRCRAAILDDSTATEAGLACIATAESCEQIELGCQVSLDGDFRQTAGVGGGGSGGESPAPGGTGGAGPDDRLCEDTCIDAGDGICDDGGAYSDYAHCQLGTDCMDCGPRNPLLCTNTCEYAGDGECDDGLAGAVSTACAVGTDCTDCGARSLGGEPGCLNTCGTAFDGRCDDGGPGSDIKFCDFGSDCADCGPR